MKKKFLMITTALIVLFVGISFCACSNNLYGDAFNTQNELASALGQLDTKFLYPTYFGEKGSSPDMRYIATKAPKEKQYSGYKIYNLGLPFFVGIYCFANVDGKEVCGDDIQRLSKEDSIDSGVGEIKMFSGKGHKDALFLIGVFTIDGIRYECRVNANKETKNNLFINAIYRDNANFELAKNVIKNVFEGMKL